jgi:hypothetical protein
VGEAIVWHAHLIALFGLGRARMGGVAMLCGNKTNRMIPPFTLAYFLLPLQYF